MHVELLQKQYHVAGILVTGVYYKRLSKFYTHTDMLKLIR